MSRPPFLKSNTSKFVSLIILAVLFLCLGKFFPAAEAKHLFINTLPKIPITLSSLTFIAAYVSVTFFIWVGPKDIFRIVAAVVYGAGLSTVLIFIAEMLNVIVLFSFSRKLGRGYIETKLPQGAKRLDQTISNTSFWRIFLLRFFPIIPMRFLDLAFGLSHISLKKYFIISFLATPLRIFYVQLFLAEGIETIMNPDRMQEFILRNQTAFFIGMVYFLGSVAVVFFLKRKNQG